MDKWDALESKVTEKKGSPKWVVILCAVIGIVLACGAFNAIVIPVIDEYLISSKDILSLYNFYENHEPVSDDEIFFVGSSIVGCGMYTPFINELLDNEGLSITTYNLKINSDTPLQRSLQIADIINLSPKCVIYGVSYRSITSIQSPEDVVWNSENARLIGDKIDINPDLQALLSDDEVNDLKQGANFQFKKRFLSSALKSKKHNLNIGYLNYERDPYGRMIDETVKSSQNIEYIINDANNPNHNWRPVITNESTRHKDALIYNVKTLEDAGITVIPVNMPLHPLVSEKITDESRQNFYDLLNQTGAKWYDYESLLDGKYFSDTHHLTNEGAYEFSPVMADLIIQEVKYGEIKKI